MPESNARKLHEQALQLREQKKFVDSLQLGDQALEHYALGNDSLGFSELLSMQAKTYLHEYNFTGFKPYLMLAKRTAEAAVDIAEASGNEDEKMLPYFNLGEVSADAGDLPAAVSAYRRAVEIMRSSPFHPHNRKSVLANFEIHLATTEYATGDQSALERAEKALKDLEESDDSSEYEKHVWQSGGHMRMAFLLQKIDPEKAKFHLQTAKEIIDSDPNLIIRKEQWQTLSKNF